jgi:hypothetical protein
VVAARAPVLNVPLTDFAPLHPVEPPDAVHVVAPTEVQVRTEVPPVTTTGGAALNVTAGTTLTVMEAILLVPPAPVQVNEYLVASVNGPVLWLPLGALGPAQPSEAMQDEAPVELHISVEEPPVVTDGGVAPSVAVAGPDAVTVTVAVAAMLGPPAPVQINEYTAVAVSAPVGKVPLVALVPVQAPEAVQDVALVELHVSVDAPPLATEVGVAVSVAVAAGTTFTVTLDALLVPLAPLHVNE